jgi:hypothetical protein
VQGCSDIENGVGGRSKNKAGVSGQSTLSWGVSGISSSAGVNAAALHGKALSTSGIALFAENAGTDSTVVLQQGGSGDLLRAFDVGTGGHGFIVRISDAGEVFSDGGFFTPAADFAEIVPAEGAFEPGDVLEVDPTTGLLRLSRGANSTLVAGVVSTSPGVLLGETIEGGASGARLALAGRVPVKATTENGAIQPGDLLVASSTPGQAMRAGANPTPGTVIGRALEGLQDGNGSVLMLVMAR